MRSQVYDYHGVNWMVAIARPVKFLSTADETACLHNKTDSHEPNGQFIAAANPVAVIALLDEIATLKKDVFSCDTILHTRIAQLERDILTIQGQLGALLARINRDGGQKQEELGTDKACIEADAQIVKWLSMKG